MKTMPRGETKITEEELSAVLGVCDALVYQAGRTTLVLGLRGSRSKKALQYKVDKQRGYGRFAGRSQEEVLAIVDGLIRDKILKLEYHDGFPLLGYTLRGLELAKKFGMEEWLALLREKVVPVTNGAELKLPFLYSVEPQRNNDTVSLLIAKAGEVADRSWLPLLRKWQSLETRRMRGELQPIIERLESC